MSSPRLSCCLGNLSSNLRIAAFVGGFSRNSCSSVISSKTPGQPRPKPLASRTCGADSRARSIESKACEGALAIGQEPRLPIFSGRFCEVCCPHRERPGTRSTQRNKSHCHTTDSGPDVRVLDFSGSCVAYLCPGTLNSISVVYGAVRRRRGRLHPRGDSLAVFFVVGYCFSKIFR